ncbi:MAG: hypothetical protein ABIL06_19360 [Pseudomonadota bacterium]|uniref:Uncharacterized protein n=2 Tax=viral metagenome TaxID=1070528 RepID=A0A6M3JUZ2_9ZZZZ
MMERPQIERLIKEHLKYIESVLDHHYVKNGRGITRLGYRIGFQDGLEGKPTKITIDGDTYSFHYLSAHKHGKKHREALALEARLKEAEEACGDAVVFIKAHPICVDLMPFTAAHIAKKLERALKDLKKEKPCYLCKGIGQHELFCSRGRQEGGKS